MRIRGLARLGVVAAALAAGAVGIAGPASADGLGGAGASACGAASYCVSVTYTGSAAPHGGGGGGYVATVAPDCWWGKPMTVAEAIEYRKSSQSGSLYSGKEWTLGLGSDEMYDKAKKQDPQPLVYRLECRSGIDPKTMTDYAGVAAQYPGYAIPNLVNFIAAGQQPPAPAVDVETLRDAAYNSIDIPEPTIERNPDVAGSGATLVNLPTQFWSPGYADTWDITASVGPVSATVVAKNAGFDLTSIAGGTSCTSEQFATAYSGGSEVGGCNFPFERASLGYPKGFPVTATATWTASWTGTPTPAAAQPLPSLTTDSTVNVPVQESQALVDTATGTG